MPRATSSPAAAIRANEARQRVDDALRSPVGENGAVAEEKDDHDEDGDDVPDSVGSLAAHAAIGDDASEGADNNAAPKAAEGRYNDTSGDGGEADDRRGRKEEGPRWPSLYRKYVLHLLQSYIDSDMHNLTPRDKKAPKCWDALKDAMQEW